MHWPEKLEVVGCLPSGQVRVLFSSLALNPHQSAMSRSAVIITLALCVGVEAFLPARPRLMSPKRGGSAVVMVAPSTARWAAGCVIGGTVGTPFVIRATQTWYRRISLPAWTPPDRVFAPTWTTLYAMMGVATAQVARTSGVTSPAVLLFMAHYCLNVMWAPVFFGLQKLRFALSMNFALIASLSVLIVQYAAVSRSSALLLLPYMAWLVFATTLNVAICKLNPTSQGYSNARLQADTARLQKLAYERAFAGAA